MQETAAHHLILLRHGKTEINEWNEKNPTAKRIGGQRESPLTHEGIEDAVQAGKTDCNDAIQYCACREFRY